MNGAGQSEQSEPSWCKRRTLLEIILGIITLILLIALIVIVVLYIVFTLHQAEPCDTPECAKAAGDLLRNIDLHVEPCDDFYKFSCGNFARYNTPPENELEVSTESIIKHLVDLQKRNMYEEAIEEDEPRPLRMVKSFYQSCMDTSKADKEGLQTIKRILSSLGGWPLMDIGWNENNFDWPITLYKFMKVGLNTDIFFSFSVEQSPSNASQHILYLNQPYLLSMGTEEMRKGLNNSHLVPDYYDYMIEVASIFGVHRAAAAKEMIEVLDFETELAKITLTSTELNNSPYKNTPMQIQQLNMNYRYIDWMIYINNMLYPTERRRPEDMVVVTSPRYFKSLEVLLANTTERTLANYIYWKTVHHISTYINEQIRDLYHELMDNAYNIKKIRARWEHCASIADRLHIASTALYVRKYFNEDSKSTVVELIDGIISQFTPMLDETKWMDDATRKLALNKSEDIHINVEFPDELLDDDKIEEYYKDLYLDPRKHLESFLNISAFQALTQFAILDKPVENKEWYASINDKTGTALHRNIIDENEFTKMTFSPKLMQGFHFNNDRPQFMNYASIGFMIAEKLMQTFHFTNENELVSWWQPETRSHYKSKAQCLLETHADLVNEHFLQVNDFVASSGAAKTAYEAWSENNADPEGLPGLTFTPEQIFWITLANTFCSVTDTDEFKIPNSNINALDYYKINLLVMNSERFAEDFECSEGSNMNPERKCIFW